MTGGISFPVTLPKAPASVAMTVEEIQSTSGTGNSYGMLTWLLYPRWYFLFDIYSWRLFIGNTNV